MYHVTCAWLRLAWSLERFTPLAFLKACVVGVVKFHLGSQAPARTLAAPRRPRSRAGSARKRRVQLMVWAALAARSTPHRLLGSAQTLQNSSGQWLVHTQCTRT